MPRTALIDVDGTLVDSNYHHTLAWFPARLRRDGWRSVLAISGSGHHTDHYIDLLDARDLLNGWTTSRRRSHRPMSFSPPWSGPSAAMPS